MAGDFAVALSQGTGGTHVDTDMPWPDLLARLVVVAGSGAAAARALGVSPTTFYRWRSGRSSRPGRPAQQPSIGKLAAVKAIRRGQLTPSKERQIRRRELALKITGFVVVSKDARRRTIHPGREFPPSVQGRILDAWLAGDDDQAEAITVKAIDTWYAPGMDLDGITEIEWEQA